jgi:pilus assembly protein Flp/PilA
MLTELKQFATSLWTRVLATREEGQAMVEYGLILSLVSIAAIVALTTIGTDLKGIFEEVAAHL